MARQTLFSQRMLFRSLIVFIIAYTILMLPATGVSRIYGHMLCAGGNFLFQDFSRGGYVKLSPQDDQGKNDITLFISRSDWKQSGKLTGATTDKASDLIGYLVTAFFTALMLATPLSWKRKIIALLAGLILITAFVMLKLRIIILHAYTQVPWFGIYQEEAARQTIAWWYQHVAANATLGYTVVVVVWLVLSLPILLPTLPALSVSGKK